MINISVFSAFLCASFMTQVAVAAAAPTCRSFFFDSVVLQSSLAAIATPESISTIAWMIKDLDSKIIAAEKAESHLGQTYKSIVDELRQIRVLGREALKSKASDQDLVFNFVFNYTGVVDYPVDFANYVGNYVGAGSVRTHSEAQFSDIKERFLSDYRNFDGISAHYAKQFAAKLNESPYYDLKSGHPYISVGKDNIPKRQFSFQYEYVFKKDYSAVLDMIRNRETGKVYVGVSNKTDIQFDGQYGSSDSLAKHDVVHAFTQKFYDQQMFDHFNAQTFDQKKALKIKTNVLLNDRIDEFLAIADKNFRDMIEIQYFIFMHEQGQSYPFGIVKEMTDSDQAAFYSRVGKANISSKYFGEDYAHLANQSHLVDPAIHWILERAQKDLKKLKPYKK